MEINFDQAIADLGGAAGIARIANEARAPSTYLLQTSVLPVRRRASYTAEDGGLVIRNVMAQMVGMDSKYPEGAAMDVSTFREIISKLAIQQNLSEKVKRHLRETVRSMIAQGEQGRVGALVVQTVLNFVQKMLLQPHWDRIEWLCGQVLFLDEIDWRFGGSVLALNYQTPAEYLFATRTGTAAYGSSASVFWADHRLAQRRLMGADYTVIGHGNTISEIVYNEANSADILAAENGRFTMRRFRGSMERPATDARDRATFVSYNLEGEVFDADGSGNTTNLPFAPEGLLLYVGLGRPDTDLVQIDQGSTNDGQNNLELGYTHLGPTEEAEGALGVWSRVYKPESMPMQLRGQSVSNTLPVMRNRKRRVVLSTEMQG
jgi:hypothetical protein